ncbi:MAG: phenylalanine--tRNA ligase subunit beta [Proteobacteria bacterium]|nr:phenylalanine--tRNA ligase subunit beta [Pseudomonadota bacterium]MBU1738148.1 phenylalanine--tRNA ligase subunit beta [Pseudomonadota bacterium]
MKFTVNWLKKYIDFDLSGNELADRLTMAGLEVDSIQSLCQKLDGVVVARVIDVSPHPDADKLVLCNVDTGKGISRIVCGAPNVTAGMVTALATPGTIMPGGFKIKPAKIRGAASEGMLCSARELGIGEDKSGIMNLPDEFVIGSPLVDALELEDTVVEVDLTPNRPDCASVIGIGREVGSFTGGRISHPVDWELPELDGKGVPFKVEIKDSKGCPRYSARLVRGVRIAPSPWWLQKYLLAVGLRPISNVVDITNFVMLEYGQPLHAFDFSLLADSRIEVRKAVPGEKTTTLDGVERALDPEMLLICDGKGPVAVAGVMGGGNSEVSKTTTDVLIESACFDPVSIRRTSRQLNLATDSSYRFERGVDPQGTLRALERAVHLIVELAGGEAVPGGVDVKDGLQELVRLTLRVSRCSKLLGLDLTAERIAKLLASIEIESVIRDDETLEVTIPGFRVDLEREVDLIEEIARLIGYNDLPTSLPNVPLSFADNEPIRDLRKRVAAVMTAQGFNEAINYSFVSEKHFAMMGLAPDHLARKTIRLMNPLAEDQSVMRTMMLPGIIENVRRNINYQSPDIRLFEIGKVFIPAGDGQPDEDTRLVAVMSGRRHPEAPVFHYGQTGADFFDVKACVENLLTELRLSGVKMVAEKNPPEYVDGASYLAIEAAGKNIGGCGRMSASCLKAFGIKEAEVFFVDLSLSGVSGLTPDAKSFKPLDRFPSVQWDIAMLIPEDAPSGEIIRTIMGSNEPFVVKAEIFDVYRGDTIETGFKSVAVAVTYRDPSATLEDEKVQKIHQKMIEIIGSRFGGKLREA